MSDEFKNMLQNNCFCPTHKIGDSVFYIADHESTDSAGPFELLIREWKNAVHNILITEYGFEYVGADSSEPFADDEGFDSEGNFWTKEEAEEYLKEIESMIYAFKEGDTVYYENPNSKRICETEVMGFTFFDGKLKYETDADFEFTYEDIGEKIFLSKDDLKKNEKNSKSNQDKDTQET